MKTIYHYHHVTGEFTCTSIADESPLEPGIALIPAYATDIPVPETMNGKRVVFSDNEWHVLEAATETSPIQEEVNETPSQKIARYEAALDAFLDSVARSHRYNDRFTFALRAAYPGPYQKEGLAFAQWMDGCNVAGYALLTSVETLTDLPSVEEFLESLPEFVIPT